MNAVELRSARLAKGWTQVQAAGRLGVTQAYLNYLENGKRRLTPALVRRATTVYCLPPEALPLPETFSPVPASDERLADLLVRLEYPGFSYLRSHATKRNPKEVLLMALFQRKLDGRVAEALPWVAWKYAQPDSWLVENARRFNLQNKLGFVATLAMRVAEGSNDPSRAAELQKLVSMLEESRLAKEDSFYRPPHTERERQWLLQNRTEDAAHWNLLADMKPEKLHYVG